jgi:hypothetical protein
MQQAVWFLNPKNVRQARIHMQIVAVRVESAMNERECEEVVSVVRRRRE